MLIYKSLQKIIGGGNPRRIEIYFAQPTLIYSLMARIIRFLRHKKGGLIYKSVQKEGFGQLAIQSLEKKRSKTNFSTKLVFKTKLRMT